MSNYEKPIVVTYEELAEGIFAASGDVADGNTADNNETKKGCQSAYMNGIFGGYGSWNGETYKERYGCNECPAAWGYCAVNNPDFNSSAPAMPGWEAQGHKGNEIVA